MLKKLVQSIQDDLGHPASLLKFVSEYPDISCLIETHNHIGHCDVISWHRWGDSKESPHDFQRPGEVRCWRYKRGSHDHESFMHHISAIENLCSEQKIENWECDIQDVEGLSASKSHLPDFPSLDELVMGSHARGMAEPQQIDNIHNNLAWHEVRICHNPPTDYFHKYTWNPRLYLINDGGSHHFSAARFIAGKLDVPVPLTSTLHTFSFNEQSVNDLVEEYEMFVMTLEDSKANCQFRDAMRNYAATYLLKRLPRPYSDYYAVLLPKNNRRSMKAATVFRNAGFTCLGAYFEGIVAAQAA